MKLQLDTVGRLPIEDHHHSVLRRRAVPIDDPTDGDIQILIAEMLKVMPTWDGQGLAAPQVFESKRLFVVAKRLIRQEVVINPRILKMSGSDIGLESCLSLPDRAFIVPRPTKLRFEAQDRTGTWYRADLTGMAARCFMHEYDHIEGVLLCDRYQEVSSGRLAMRGPS